jgi:hypothetical protein
MKYCPNRFVLDVMNISVVSHPFAWLLTLLNDTRTAVTVSQHSEQQCSPVIYQLHLSNLEQFYICAENDVTCHFIVNQRT